MSTIDIDKREEIISLVKSQKKAKLAWVATISQVSEEALRNSAEKMGLLVEGDFILLPSESKVQKIEDTVQAKREQIVNEIVSNRYYSYNPGVGAAILFDNIKSLYSKRTLGNALVRKGLDMASEAAQKVRYTIITFEGQMLDVKYHEAVKIIENMKNQFLVLPDEILRLHVSVKKYFEFFILPRIKSNITAAELNEFRIQVTSEDNRLRTLAIQAAQNSMVDQKLKRKRVLEATFRMPDSSLQIVKADQFEQFAKQLVDLYHFEFRRQFFEHPTFIDQILKQYG